jgi:glycosyltransferase involved in cell wall biosynthesis
MRRELGLSDDEFCIGCVANLHPVKDHLTLLKAVAEFGRSCSDWRLLLVGTGPQRAALEEFVRADPNCRDRVSFLGRSDRVPELLKAMDVWVLPSVAEGLSNALLEAMATGLPVVATDTGGNPEVVVDGHSGLLFPVGDNRKLAAQLLMMQSQRELRASLGSGALQRVRREFSIDSMISKYECVYESLARPETAPARAIVGT